MSVGYCKLHIRWQSKDLSSTNRVCSSHLEECHDSGTARFLSLSYRNIRVFTEVERTMNVLVRIIWSEEALALDDLEDLLNRGHVDGIAIPLPRTQAFALNCRIASQQGQVG